MPFSTRSQTSADAELEIRQKQLDEREKQLRAQHQSLLHECEVMERRANEAIDTNSLMQMLSQIQTELSHYENYRNKLIRWNSA